MDASQIRGNEASPAEMGSTDSSVTSAGGDDDSAGGEDTEAAENATENGRLDGSLDGVGAGDGEGGVLAAEPEREQEEDTGAASSSALVLVAPSTTDMEWDLFELAEKLAWEGGHRPPAICHVRFVLLLTVGLPFCPFWADV